MAPSIQHLLSMSNIQDRMYAALKPLTSLILDDSSHGMRRLLGTLSAWDRTERKEGI